MSFSDWQIRVIRDALAAHRLYTPGERQSHLSWFELTARVEAYGDVELGKDLLRQFVEGVSKKNPGQKRVPETATLKAIVTYLTDAHIDALAEEELKNERALAYQAPLRLLQYLKQDLDTETLNPPVSLSGNYHARCTFEDGGRAEVTVSLDCASGGPLIAATETLVRYHRAGQAHDRRKSRDGNENLRKHSRGWAILTPEDNLLVFMKEEPYGYNHYYLTLAIDSNLWSEPTISELVLLRRDYPLELEPGESCGHVALDQIARHTQNDIVLFAKVN